MTQKMGKVIIQDLAVMCIVGIHEVERRLEQQIVVTVEMTTDIGTPAESHNIEDAVDYDQTARQMRDLIQQGRYLLIETMSEDIADLILKNPKVVQVRVRIQKPMALAHVNAKYAAVEIVRGAI